MFEARNPFGQSHNHWLPHPLTTGFYQQGAVVQDQRSSSRGRVSKRPGHSYWKSSCSTNTTSMTNKISCSTMTNLSWRSLLWSNPPELPNSCNKLFPRTNQTPGQQSLLATMWRKQIQADCEPQPTIDSALGSLDCAAPPSGRHHPVQDLREQLWGLGLNDWLGHQHLNQERGKNHLY